MILKLSDIDFVFKPMTC